MFIAEHKSCNSSGWWADSHANAFRHYYNRP